MSDKEAVGRYEERLIAADHRAMEDIGSSWAHIMNTVGLKTDMHSVAVMAGALGIMRSVNRATVEIEKALDEVAFHLHNK